MRMNWQGLFVRTAVAVAAASALAANAQPVRLRLANSLCTSMTNQTLTAQLVPPLSSSAAAGSAVNTDLAQRMEEQRQGFFSRLDGLVPFNGLYAVGQADQSF